MRTLPPSLPDLHTVCPQICTELVTGYAAAALILPMALRVAQELEVRSPSILLDDRDGMGA